MSDSDQILDKYAQLKLDLKLQEEEKQRKIQEELDAKNPLKQYEKIQRELAESKKKYSKEIQENIIQADAEIRLRTEEIEKDKNEKEEKALKSLENLFLKLGGNLEEIEEEEKTLNEDDTGPELQVMEVAEKQKEDDVEEPVGVVEEGIGHEEDIKVDEKREEIAEQEEITVDAVATAISKQEKDREKPKDKTPTSKRIKLLEEKVTKIIKQMSTIGGGGEVKLNNLDDVDTTGLANDKILKYNSTTSKWAMADAGGAAVDLSAVAQNIVPDADGTRDLGTSSKKFKDLHLSGSSIVLGTTTLSIDGTGEFQVQKTGDSSASRVASFSKTNLPFTKADGTSSSIETKSDPTTFSTFFDNMFIPFTKADGTEVTTLKLGS